MYACATLSTGPDSCTDVPSPKSIATDVMKLPVVADSVNANVAVAAVYAMVTVTCGRGETVTAALADDESPKLSVAVTTTR